MDNPINYWYQKYLALKTKIDEMMKDAVEFEVTDVGLNHLDLALFEAERLGLNKGDKVKVIVLKEDN